MENPKKLIPVDWDIKKSKGHCRLAHVAQLYGEGLFWLNESVLNETLQNENQMKKKSIPEIIIRERLTKDTIENGVTLVNTNWRSLEEWETLFEKKATRLEEKKKNRVHLLALGDVGSTVLTALKLLGGDCIDTLGIYDVSPNVCKRWESELNQAMYPFDSEAMPEVVILEESELFACDVFIFCASKGIPKVGDAVKDVRMAQLEANQGIISSFAKKARESKFDGLFAVVSDPVDPLCKTAFVASNTDESGEFDGKGLLPEQIQGYGLGVMNGRAVYYAKQDKKFEMFLSEGRAYGPHGGDLVIANSIENYDDELSLELTKLAVESNLKTRDLGFKPYVAPAISSAAISILLTMRGEWHYSSNFLAGVYMGCKNRTTAHGLEIEFLPLVEKLYKRIETAYVNLEKLV
ncbi:MAG: lactate dehydrogenase [Bacillota bacterium]